MKVKVRVRGRQDRIGGGRQPAPVLENLFVRLHPNTARRLHSLALEKLGSMKGGNLLDHSFSKRNEINLWAITYAKEFTRQVESGVEFLPLRIQIRSRNGSRECEPEHHIVYASYNGGSILSGDDIDLNSDVEYPVIEMDGRLLPTLLTDNSQQNDRDVRIDLEPLPSIYNAESIHLEPLSADDWELLEIHGNELEAGTLLSQVCVVYPGQKLPIRIGRHNEIAWVQVLAAGFGCDDENEVEGDSDINADELDSDESFVSGKVLERQEHECLRLVADTEVIVVPKLCNKPAGDSSGMKSCSLWVYPTVVDYNSDMEELFEATKSQGEAQSTLADCPPWFTAAVHPLTLDKLLSSNKETNLQSIITVQRADSTSTTESRAIAARVIQDECVPHGSISLHPGLRYQANVTPLCDYLVVQAVFTEQIDASYRHLKMGVEGGHRTVELVPFQQPSPVSRSAQPNPWRIPPIVSLPKCSTHAKFCMNGSSETSLINVDDCIPICSGTLIPGSFLSGASSDSNDEAAYRLKITENKGGKVFESSGKCLVVPATSLSLQHLSLLLDLSRQSGKRKGINPPLGNPSPAVPPTPYEQPHDRMLNLNALPANATCIKDTMDEAFGAAQRMRWPSFTLLAGEKGSGKTHFALIVAALARIHFGIGTTYLDCSKLQSSPTLRMRNILDEVDKVFEDAARSQPTMVILDDLHSLVPDHSASSDEENDAMHHQQISPALSGQVKLISDHLRHLFRENANVCVLATCNDCTSVDPSLRHLWGFSSRLNVPVLNSKQLVEVFDAMLKRLIGQGSTVPSAANLLPSFGKQVEGYRPADLLVLASRVAHFAHVRELGRFSCEASKIISADVLEHALKSYTPIFKQNLHDTKKATPLDWISIGGLFRAKAALTDTVLHPIRYNAIYNESPVSLPRGLLLHGPSGCGKSLIAPALAKECNFSLVRCNGPELLDKYIGASEAATRQLFARAYAASPCILFLDDFDALAPRRGTDHTGVTDRVVNQLLTFLDGVESAGNKKGMVYIIGATSRPDKIDPALLRPGRLEKHIYIGYADSDEEWSDLFSRVASSWDLDQDICDFVLSGELLRQHGKTMKHLRKLSGADMKAVMDTAHLAAIHDYLDRAGDMLADDTGTGTDQVRIELRHIIEALRSARPSLDDDMRMAHRNDTHDKGDIDMPSIGSCDGHTNVQTSGNRQTLR